MTDAFGVLGLDRTADARAIKRAYAALLRVHRPDEDPAGFQRINDAYQAALAYRAWVDAHGEPIDGDNGAHEDGVVLPDPLPHAPTPRATPTDDDATPYAPIAPVAEAQDLHDLDAAIDQLLDEMLALARAGKARPVLEFLRSSCTYWSMEAKQRLAGRLVARLEQEPVAMPRECFDALMGFFGLDDIQVAQDLRHIGHLRMECEQWWLLRRRAPRATVTGAEDRLDRAYRAMINRLHEPFSWWNAPWYALRPSAAVDVVQFVRSIGLMNGSRLPPSVDPATIRFWVDQRMLDPPLNRARATVFALRALLGALAFALLAAWVERDLPRPAWVAALDAFGVCTLVALGWLAVQVYNRWQGWRGPFEWPAWLVPLLVLATLVSLPFSVDGFPSQMLSVTALMLPVWRDVHAWMRRRGSAVYDEPSAGSVLMLCLVIALSSAPLLWLEDWVPALLGLPLWAWQLWRIRKAHATP